MSASEIVNKVWNYVRVLRLDIQFPPSMQRQS